MKILLSSLLAIFLFIGNMEAQCTIFGTSLGSEQNNSVGSNLGNEDAQSFTACASGNITSISLRKNPNNVYSGLVNLWLISGTVSMGSEITQSQIYQQFTVTSGEGIETIELTVPFPVVEGSIYTFGVGAINASPNLIFNSQCTDPGSPYPGGAQITTEAPPSEICDLNFSVNIEAAEDIPNIPPFGLVILGLLISGLSLVIIKIGGILN